MQEPSGHSGNHSEQTGSQAYPEGTAPEKWVCNMNFSVRTLMNQGSAGEALPCQCTKGLARFILFCEISNQNANAHYLVL